MERGFRAQENLQPAQNYLARLQIQMLESVSEGVNGDDGGAGTTKDEPLDLVFKGRTCMVQAKLNQEELVFGRLQALEQKTLEFQLKNDSQNLALPFHLQRTAHFKFQPAQGCLAPMDSQTIQVTFSPNQIGIMDKFVQIQLFGRIATERLQQLRLRVQGTCYLLPTTSPSHKSKSRPVSTTFADFEDSDDSLDNNHTHNTPPSTAQTNYGSDDSLGYENNNGDTPRFERITAHEPLDLEERRKHDEHRRKYGDMIRTNRKGRLLKQRQVIFHGQRENENALDNKRATHDIVEEWRKTDVDNGLLPPEPQPLKKVPNFKIADALGANLHTLMYYRRNVVSLASDNGATAGDTMVEPNYCHSDERRLLMLFQRLLESGHSLAKNAPLITVDGNGLLQKLEPTNATNRGEAGALLNSPLTAGELSNVFMLQSKLDFGVITNHSPATTTLCFLNATTTKVPITISLLQSNANIKKQQEKQGSPYSEHFDRISLEPSSLQIPPLSVGIFHVTLESHRSNVELNNSHGYVETQLTYQVNDKFKYNLPVVATMNPIQVELRGDSLAQGEVKLHATITKSHATAPPHVETTLQLINHGSSRARYSWNTKDRMSVEDGGLLELVPSSGFIPAKSSIQLRVVYRPGMKTRTEQNFALTIYDPYYDTQQTKTDKEGKMSPPVRGQKPGITFADPHDSSILSVILVKISGEVAASKYTIIGLPEKMKSIPKIDFGILPVSTPQFAAYAKTRPPKLHRFYSSKLIKIRNSGSSLAYFTVTNSNVRSEVAAYPMTGVIDPDGGVLELLIWVIPSRPSDQPVEDYVLVNIAGSGRQIRIPVLYESKTPQVECFRSASKAMQFSAAVGSQDRQELFMRNTGPVAAKVLFDLRHLPEMSIGLAKAFTTSHRSPEAAAKRRVSVASKHQATSTLDTKNNEMMFRLARIGEDDDMIEWCLRNYVTSFGSNQEPFSTRLISKYEQQPCQLFALELLPTQQVLISITYKPTEKAEATKMLPMRVFGVSGEHTSSTDPLNMTFPVHLSGFVSPLKISRSTIVFKNKIVHVRDPSTVQTGGQGGGPMRASVASREAIELRNVGDEAITWTLDPEIFGESADLFGSRNTIQLKHSVGTISTSTASSDVFKFDVWNGILQPGEMTTITSSFFPPVTGHYATSVSIYVNYQSTLHPSSCFLLEFSGTGVEPALIFDPPEIFIPVSPQGEESVVVFSLINYGYDRNEVSFCLNDDLKMLLCGKRSKKEKLALAEMKTQQAQQAANGVSHAPTTNSSATAEDDLMDDEKSPHGSIKLLFPEGKQLKGDGKPLPVVLRFKSPVAHSLSFTSHIRFFVYDSGAFSGGVSNATETKPKKSFYLSVNGTSDCSALTLWPSMERQEEEELVEDTESTGGADKLGVQRAMTISQKAMIYDRLKAHGVNTDDITKRYVCFCRDSP